VEELKCHEMRGMNQKVHLQNLINPLKTWHS